MTRAGTRDWKQARLGRVDTFCLEPPESFSHESGAPGSPLNLPLTRGFGKWTPAQGSQASAVVLPLQEGPNTGCCLQRCQPQAFTCPDTRVCGFSLSRNTWRPRPPRRLIAPGTNTGRKQEMAVSACSGLSLLHGNWSHRPPFSVGGDSPYSSGHHLKMGA